jgi:hypothetical protein
MRQEFAFIIGFFNRHPQEVVIEIVSSGLVSDAPVAHLRRPPPPLAQPEQHHDDGAREQEVNGPAQGVTTPQPEHP